MTSAADRTAEVDRW